MINSPYFIIATIVYNKLKIMAISVIISRLEQRRMHVTHYQWQVSPTISDPEFETFKNQIKSPFLAELLWQRGIQTKTAAEAFLAPNTAQLHDPYLLNDMQKAVDRIQEAVFSAEKIVIYGDYDADGITSTALMYENLNQLGADVSYYLPDRFKDGYGPNLAVYQQLIEAGAQLIITVDNGVTGVKEVAYAKEHGVDVVITDHHELPDVLPDAVAVVHPKHPNANYPFEDLSGVGVAFKVVTALLEEIPYSSLDLVAIGEICDLVSLTGENRALVSLGIKQLQVANRLGINALCKVAKIEQSKIDATKVGFTIGPRLNALGRIEDASVGVQLLTTTDEIIANELAEMTESLNRKRQELVATVSEEALEMAQQASYQEQSVLVLAHPNWHEGILGIVASHIVTKLHKPTIVLTIDETTGQAKGSARSIGDFHIFNAIESQSALLARFGGHKMVAGLSLAAENIAEFQQGLQTYCQNNTTDLAQKETLEIALKLTLDQINQTLYQEIQQLAPFGMDNPLPLIEIDNLPAQQVKQIGADGKHLKFMLQDQQTSLPVLAFNFGEDYANLASQNPINVVGQLDENSWQNQVNLQLLLKDYALDSTVIVDQRANQLSKRHYQNQGTYVCFETQHYEKLKTYLKQPVVMASDFESSNVTEVTLFDTPANVEELTQFLKGLTVAKINLIGYQETSVYLQGMPTKEQFAQVFIYLKQHPNIAIKQSEQLAAYLKMKPELLKFILQVFLDLEFVKIETGLINVNDNATKKEIKTAQTYQKRLAKMNLEQQLIYSTSTQVQATIKMLLVN